MRPYIARSRYIRMPHIVPDKDAVQAVITGSHDHSPCPIGDDFSDANALVLQPLRKLVLISMRRDENLSSALSRLCCRTVSGIGCVTGGVPTGDLLGGGGGWMPGTYDAETNTVWWGTANPSPLYDWSGSDWQKSGPRPGTNLYTTSVIALDPDTGKLKFYHQDVEVIVVMPPRRTLCSHARFTPASRHSARLIAALTKMRSTSRSSAAARISDMCSGPVRGAPRSRPAGAAWPLPGWLPKTVGDEPAGRPGRP